MNTFLEDLFKDKKLKELDEWSRSFWSVNSKTNNLKTQFAQQGYEDKGQGHIQRIISNVGELLENYFTILYELNNLGDKGEALREMKEAFKANLILFYVVAHLHDIGMKFPGIFKALSEYVKEKSQNPLHIGKITHEYHHYISFIILLEMSCREIDSAGPYWSNIDSEDLKSSIIKDPEDDETLNFVLKNIFDKCFGDFKESIGNFLDFKVILAILCLLHREVNNDYVQSILRNFKEKNTKNYIVVNTFNKWWSYFDRAKSWTDDIYQRYQRLSRDDSSKLPKCDNNELMLSKNTKDTETKILDLLLVEGLLQYGDKTDITIARLARKPLNEDGNPITKIPLKNFIEDTKYDGPKGYICTNIAQGVISGFARTRACLFIPVLLVTVEDMPGKSKKVPFEKVKPELNIVIHYLRFDGDDDVFRRIRYYDEKDFFDLDFLRVIRFHLPVVLKNNKESRDVYNQNPVFTLTFKNEEHSIKDEKNLKKLFSIFPFHISSQYDLVKLLKSLVDVPENSSRQPNAGDDIKEMLKSLSGSKSIEALIVETDIKNFSKKILKTLIIIFAAEEKLGGLIDKCKSEIDNLAGLIKSFRTIFNEDDGSKNSLTFKKLLEILSNTIENEEKSKKLFAWFANTSEGKIKLEELFGIFVKILDENDELKKILKVLTSALKENHGSQTSGTLSDENNYYSKKILKAYPYIIEKKDDLKGFLQVLNQLDKNNFLKEYLNPLLEILKKDDGKSEFYKDFPDTIEGLKILRRTILGDKDEGIQPRKNFPYTRQNLEAIERISQPYLDSEGRFKMKEPGKVFYETCDLDVPASFELMAVLNLFMEEEG